MHILCYIYSARRLSEDEAIVNCSAGGVGGQEGHKEDRAFLGNDLSHGKYLLAENIIPLFRFSSLNLGIRCKYLFPKPHVFSAT